jgi:hypothetical protein
MSLINEPLWRAQNHAQAAFKYLVEARTQKQAGVYHEYRMERAIEELQAAAAALGFELVKIEASPAPAISEAA